MTAAELASHLANVARRNLAKEAAIVAMTPEQRSAFEARQVQKRGKADARNRTRTEARERAIAAINAHVDSMHLPSDFPLSERETAIPQNEATMRGILLAEFPRPNGGRALVVLREWKGALRILFTIAYVENGRAVRSRGWTLYLRDATSDGEVALSTRELRALYEAIGLLVARLESGDAELAADVGRLQDAREQAPHERKPRVSGDPDNAGGAP
jgi:hypothetical protein